MSEETTVIETPAAPAAPAASAALLSLDGERAVSFKDRGQAFTYFFRRIGAEDWRKFFAGIVLETERSGNGRIDRFDFRTAGLALVEATVQRVEGYALKTGGSIMELKEWRARLPYGHQLKAAELLQRVTATQSESNKPFDPEADEVELDAAWGSSKPGVMTQYRGLVHRFRPVSAENKRRFDRGTSEAKVIGGSRAGRTIYPDRHALLATLYDDLVLSVDGYSVAAQPLASPEQIKKEMDSFHKMAAVQQLFATPDDGEEEAA